MKKCSLLLVLLFLIFPLLSCEKVQENGTFLQDITTFELHGGNTEGAKTAMAKFLQDLENQISPTVQGSDLCKINEAEAEQAIKAGKYTKELFTLSKTYHELTEGAFDPALYPLTLAWNFSGGGTLLSESQIADILPSCGLDLFRMEGDNIIKSNSLAKLDFGGIAKGYAADVCRQIAGDYSVEWGIINIGGNIYLIGSKTNNTNFTVGIRDPRRLENKNSGYFCKLGLSEISVVTSGDYERYFTHDGVRYCHILDPKTGYPSRSGLISVTVADGNSAHSDAFSTALFVMGMEKAIEFATENNLTVILIDEQMKYYSNVTQELSDVFSAYSVYER